MKDFDKSYNEVLLMSGKLKNKFLEYIRNKEIPVIERLEAYEKYAKSLLPVGRWRSNAPRWILEDIFDTCERHELVDFTNIVEDMYGIYSDLEYDEEGKLIFVSEELAEKLNQLLDTGLSGTCNDW